MELWSSDVDVPPTRPGYGEGRQALIDAAIRVVARSGLRGLTYRSVAGEAGVTQGLVAHHFGSRRELIKATFEQAAHDSIERSSLEPPSGRLDDFARDLPTRMAAEAEVEAFQFELALEARRNPDVAPAARHVYRTYMTATEHALRSVGIAASEDLSRLVFAALDGLAFQQLLFEDLDATERARTELIALLRAAMDAPPSGPS